MIQSLIMLIMHSLSSSLVEFGAAASAEEVAEMVISRAELQSQYESGVLDMCRLAPRSIRQPASIHQFIDRQAINQR